MKNQPDDAPEGHQLLKPDMQVSPWVTVHAAHPALDDAHWFAVSAQAIFDADEQRYILTDVEIQRPISRGGLSAVDIRDVPIMSLIGPALMRSVSVETAEGPVALELPDAEALAQMTRDERLLACARRYALARATGQAALKTLAEWMGASQSTATRTVAEARQRGLLD